jgi:hypothetical protein
MAELVGTTGLGDLMPVASEAGAAEGHPRPVYTWTGRWGKDVSLVRSYVPSDGDAPRLVAVAGGGGSLGVWHTGTGAVLAALPCPKLHALVASADGCTVKCLAVYDEPTIGATRLVSG